jgi:hypothetical protein
MAFAFSIFTPRQIWVVSEGWDLFIHQALGTTSFALLIGLAILIVTLLLQSRRHLTARQWRLALKNGWDRSGKYVLAVTIGVYLAAFVICIYNARKREPTYSSEQIAQYGKGVVIAISDAAPFSAGATTVKSSGFWVSTNGLALTCFEAGNSNDQAQVLIPMPQMIEGPMKMPSGYTQCAAQVLLRDLQTGVLLIYVENNPFQRTLHATAMVVYKSGKKFISRESYWATQITEVPTKIGDRIFLICPESKGQELTMRMVEGRVERDGLDVSAIDRGKRLHTSIPFRPEYRGAPILNSSEKVIGVVVNSDEDTVFAPAEYLLMMKTNHNSSLPIWQ